MCKQLSVVPMTLAVTAFLVTAGCSDTARTPPLAPSSHGSTSGASLASSSGGLEYADVSIQGGGGVYAANGATLARQPSGLHASVSMPTPEPGTYNYPAGRTPGHPEVFTLWIFVFNYPDLCSAPCSADDLGDTPAKGGAYNGGGHFASGEHLTIAGRIGIGETPFRGSPLELPGTAEVHLAVAPHGAVDPSQLPEEFRLPTGPMSLWWVAIFP